MPVQTYDVIVVGAGSIGVPTALALAEKKMKVLVVESLPSAGQGQNKAAIGGIRATHSDGSKIRACLRSLEIFGGWEEKYGDNIGWHKGGYTFPAYTESDEKLMRDLLKVQRGFGLNIDWISKENMLELVPGISRENLRGGTYCPDDASASPLLSSQAFYRRARKLGVEFRFKESVASVLVDNGVVKGLVTSKDTYHAPWVINAAGANAKDICSMVRLEVPIMPDTHEAAVTEPVRRMFDPMVVDIRPDQDSKNCYFYQNEENQVIFCYTLNPQVWGTCRQATSAFLPTAARRLVNLLPKLSNVKVRRTWRGLYPMTPDGFPIVDAMDEPRGFVVAGGMCGQGFMMGPGTGELVAGIVTGSLTPTQKEILAGFSSKRSFTGMEKFS